MPPPLLVPSRRPRLVLLLLLAATACVRAEWKDCSTGPTVFKARAIAAGLSPPALAQPALLADSVALSALSAPARSCVILAQVADVTLDPNPVKPGDLAKFVIAAESSEQCEGLPCLHASEQPPLQPAIMKHTKLQLLSPPPGVQARSCGAAQYRWLCTMRACPSGRRWVLGALLRSPCVFAMLA